MGPRRCLLELLPYGAGTIPFRTARESCDYVERYFSEFPFVPQDFEAEALELWRGREFPRIKTQDWGPVSGEVADLEAYCDRLERAARGLVPLAPRRWLVLDEPVFQSIGGPFFPGNPDLAIETVNAVINSTRIPAKWGLHVCGNTDFGLLARLDIELFHFDAWMAWDALKLYQTELSDFVASGRLVAPGLVPVGPEEGEAERCVAIARDAERVLGDLGQRELPLGPACGMKAVSEERADQVGLLLRDLLSRR
jgi:hypothetical protein